MHEKIRALIVDDELWARKRILSLLKGEKDFEVVGECADGESAAKAILCSAPDVVFLDVQMPGMNGLEVLQAIEPGAWPLVVFVTAFDKYAVRAFEVHALDYLLKPFDEERFHMALGRVRHDLDRGRSVDRGKIEKIFQLVAGGRKYLQRIGVKSGGRVVFLKSTEVDWFEAAGNYITLHVGKDSHLIRESMNELEPKLDPNQFVRIQRSAIVNLDRIKELQPWFRGQQMLVLKDGTQLAVGRTFRIKLRGLFENKVLG